MQWNFFFAQNQSCWILPLAKLDIVDSRLVSNSLIFIDYIPVDIQLLTFLLLSSLCELSIGAKIKKSDNHRHL